MEPRTRQGRGSARKVENRRGASPSLLASLLGRLTEHVARSAVNRVKREARAVVRWTVPRLVLGWVVASILTGGILFVLGAGLKGLEALRCPSWLAHLSTGVFAILVALVALRGILWPAEEVERD